MMVYIFYYVIILRLKDPSWIVNAFNVDPLYLKHDMQGSAPDYRVRMTSHKHLHISKFMLCYLINKY